MPAAYELVGSEHSPPVHQQISKDEKDWPTQQDLAALRDSLERKESELQAAQERLNDQQRLLTAKIAHWACQDEKGVIAAAIDVGNDAAGSPLLGLLKEERALLLTRWQCLLEEKRQLTAMMRVAAAGPLRDFEPGEAAVRDLTCAVVTHQFDAPCLSCCFQR